jgi:hypothetical protein
MNVMCLSATLNMYVPKSYVCDLMFCFGTKFYGNEFYVLISHPEYVPKSYVCDQCLFVN